MNDNRRLSGNQDDLTVRVRELAALLGRVLRKIDRAAELAEHMAIELERLTEELAAAGATTNEGGIRLRSRRKEAPYARILEQEACSGVPAVEFVQRNGDGRALVRVHGHPPLKLPPTLAILLAILCRRTGLETDHLVGWKKTEEVAKELGSRLGRGFDPHTVSNSVYRLRIELDRAGINPFLVQTSRVLGARFAVIHQGRQN